MKNISLAAGAAVIVLANALTLIHAARNRTGSPDAELTLTNRELTYRNTSSDDDSGVALYLQWTTPDGNWMGYGSSPKWLDQQKLQSLGFDCRVSPDGEDALRFYQRQRPRNVFLALEYGGQAWQDWLDAYQRGAEERAKRGLVERNNTQDHTHLVAVDADLDAGALRARHPDRSSVMIVPALVAIALEPYPYPGYKPDPKSPVKIAGRIQQLASSIHIPRPLSDGFPRRDQRKDENSKRLSYTVRLRDGSLFEPWVTGVEFSR